MSELIHAMFEEQAKKTPNKTAIISKNCTLTFDELNQQANKIANLITYQYQTLYGKALTPDTLIGIFVDRDVNMVSGILGILKSGAAYLPIDISLPKDRINYMLQDARPHLILTSKKYCRSLSPKNNQFIYFEDADTHSEQHESPHTASPNNLAYVMYTSGSTGKPKGVMIEHHSVVNVVLAQQKNLNIAENDRVLQFASIGFDVSISEILSALFIGATLVIATEIEKKSLFLLCQLINKYHISIVGLTPAFLAILPRITLPSIKTLRIGGDLISEQDLKYWAQHIRFINSYGPTETTVCVCQNIYEPGHLVAQIGMPLHGASLYVLNKDLHPVKNGQIGELYIGGQVLARGYLNDSELTAEKFIQNPFSKNKHERLYKTGDLVKRLPDGNILFISRMDEQVKINGFRIEPKEIENIIREYPYIINCAVLSQTHHNKKRLIAYFVVDKKLLCCEHSECCDIICNLRKFILSKLPPYMLPAMLIEVPKISLNQSGKVDRSCLPLPKSSRQLTKITFKPPRTKIEMELAQMCQKILHIEDIGICDNFFTIGGSSLQAIQLLSNVFKRYGVALTYTKQLTIATLSEQIQQTQQYAEIS